MSEQALQLPLPGFEQAETAWRRDYNARLGDAANPRNRSGIEVKPLYTARRLERRALHGGPGLSGPTAHDPRHLPEHASRPDLEPAPG